MEGISLIEEDSAEEKSEEDLENLARIEREKLQILRDVADSRVGTLQQRIAWVLNHFPEARDSDISCQIKYWEVFEKDEFDPVNFKPQDLYRLTKLTSIARSRAKIQNVHNLFLASPEVRRHRGKLEDEEKDKALSERPSYPVYAIYADESGKTADHLIVGSMWILNGIETMNLVRAIDHWRERSDFHSEFHFKAINKSKLPKYLEVLSILKERSSTISFKALSVERKGISNNNDALTKLFLNLLIKGVEHEDHTGRAPLPRSLQLWKDSEEVGSDKLMLEEIKTRLREVSSSVFDNKLFPDEFVAVDSKDLVLIQLADLFTSSVNRLLNSTGKREHPKDEFAEKFLAMFGMTNTTERFESLGDCALHSSL